MATIINDGWLILTDGSNTLKLFFEKTTWDFILKGRILHYDSAVNLFIPILKKYLIVYAEGIWLNTHQKLTDCMDYLSDWQGSAAFTLSVSRDGTNFIEMDGDNTTFTVAIKGKIQGAEKVSPGTQQIYRIGKIVFEQAG